MKLIVGLGNPGEKYARNRHNVGFMALERIADKFGRGGWRKKFSARVCDADIDGDKALLICPQTFYNEAGRAVSEAARFHKIDAEDIIVFHDEIDLVPGKVRVKTGGGLAGNNGLRSISSHMGPGFVRVRVGVGHPGDKNAVKYYVLNDFPKDIQDGLDVMLDAMAAAAPHLAGGSHDKFQTHVAQALNDYRDAFDDDDDAEGKSVKSKKSTEKSDERPEMKTANKPIARHPSGERGNKRQSALADNLKRWLAGRANKDN